MPGLNHLVPTPDRDVWTEKAAIIRKLYLSERKTLKQVKETLEREHEFPTFPLSTYETALRDKLRLRKKFKRTDWPIVYHHYRNRAGKETGIYLNGVRIPWNKAWKEIRRSGARSMSNFGQPGPLPEDVVVRTPSPVARSMSPTFSQLQMSLPSAFPPPAQISLVAHYGFIDNSSLECNSYAPNLPMGFTHGSLHDLSVVQYPTQIASEVDAMAGTPTFDMSFYRSFLQTTPWNQFNKKMHSIIGDVAQCSDILDLAIDSLFDNDIIADFACSPPSPLVHRAALRNTTPPRRPNGNSTALALNFSSYHFLTKFLNLLSNKIHLERSPDINRRILDFFDILVDRLPNRFSLKLFESDLPTMRAIWEASVPLAYRVDHKGAFSLLMEIGLRHPDWICVNGHMYLSHAISMGCNGIVKDLLKIGVRPDDAFLHDALSVKPAILEAAIAEDLDCIKELIQRCDVNRNIEYSPVVREYHSNFDMFVSALMQRSVDGYHRRRSADATARKRESVETSLEKGIYSLVLDIFLENGANVDLPWRGYPWRAISDLHVANGTPVRWKPSLLDQSFYWDTALYNRLRLYSAKEGKEVTRPGICLSAKRGKVFLQAYLNSRPAHHPADRTKLLELILAEQFLFEDTRVVDLEIIRGLVDFGVDISLPHLEFGFHSSNPISLPLRALVVKSRLDGFTRDFSTLFTLLISKGAIIDADAIEAAVAKGGLGVLPELEEHGADIRSQGGLALCTAARWSNYEAVSWLLQVGVDINADVYIMNEEIPRAIIAIASNYNPYVFSLPRGDEFFRNSKEYCSANSEMLGYLIRCGAKLRLNSQNPSHFHFLKAILSTWSEDVLLLDNIELFLNFTISKDLATADRTLLELCLAGERAGFRRQAGDDEYLHQRLAIYELLFRRGCPVLRESGLACYILCGGRHEIIFKVLDAGADVNTCSVRRSIWPGRAYPLQSAAIRGDLELVKQLLQRGAVINQPALGKRGRTALQGACEWPTLSTEERRRKMDLIRLLINQGADVNAPAARREGLTALQIAALYGDIELALILLERVGRPQRTSCS